MVVSRPRRVDDYDSDGGEWTKTKAGLHLGDLAAIPTKTSHTADEDTCSDAVDLLWNAMMNK